MNSARSLNIENHQIECPSANELSLWLERGGVKLDSIAEHIEHCRSCNETLERITQSTLVESYVQSAAQRPIGLSFLNPPERAGDLGRLDHYAVERQLDAGGMGVVFRAWDMQLQRPVAIKLMRMFDNAVAIERFRREARAVAKLTHDNIVPIHSVAETRDGRPYLVMPLVRGESLRQRLNQSSVDPREAAEWIRQVACGLQFAHEAGLIHRDIKPANILLDARDGRAKLTDFGLVQEVDGHSLTQTDGILGTPEFMSPEQIRNQALDGRSDVYSLGIALYQCLTGVTPFRGQTFEVLQQQQDQMPLAPTIIRPDIPRDLETICLKAIRKEPDSRYESAQALAEDLTRFLNGEPILARRASFAERFSAWVRRHPWQTLSATLAVLVFVGTAISVVMLARSYESERKTNLALLQMRDEADQSFQLTRSQLSVVANRIKDDLMQVPQAERIAVESIRDIANLYFNLNQLRPGDQQVAEEYVSALQALWYAEWLYDGGSLEQQARERYQTESARLLAQFPTSSTIAALRAELLLDLAGESENDGDQSRADAHFSQGQALLLELLASGIDTLPVRSLVWKAAWQEFSSAGNRKLSAEQIVELARNMVQAQQSVIELTPIDKRTEAICIGIDQMSRLVEAQIEAQQSSESLPVLEQARALLGSLDDSARETLEVRQAQIRLLRAELQLAKADADVELQKAKIEQLVNANRSQLTAFPDGETQMISLVQSLLEQVDLMIAQGQGDHTDAIFTEIELFLEQIEANPSVAKRSKAQREKLELLRQKLKE
ncbi:MAG: serine/threonine protein kinase [Pirellulaceae bacterium]|nr:serine/threonine protein kinase [Pirellulaceae bacterium]